MQLKISLILIFSLPIFVSKATEQAHYCSQGHIQIAVGKVPFTPLQIEIQIQSVLIRPETLLLNLQVQPTRLFGIDC